MRNIKNIPENMKAGRCCKVTCTEKVAAFSTIEVIILIIIVVGLVSMFGEGARSFITSMWNSITTAAQGLFN